MSETRSVLVRLAAQHDIHGARFNAFLDALDRKLSVEDAANVQELLRATLAPGYTPVFVHADPEPDHAEAEDADSIDAGAHADEPIAGAGNDLIAEGQGAETAVSSGANDTVEGGAGNDVVTEAATAKAAK